MTGETAHVGCATGRTTSSHAGRRWLALPAVAVTCFVLVRLAFDNGGYFPSSFLTAGATAFVALAILLPFAFRQRFSRRALVALGSLALLACWIGLSGVWTTAPDAPLVDMQRTMLYVALFGLGLLAANSGRHARLLVWSILAMLVVVCGAGLLSRLHPDVLKVAVDTSAAGYRLDYPLRYWNAFGAFASLGAVLAIGLAADLRGTVIGRAASAGAFVLLVVAMYLSLSRGAWLALAIGLVVLVAVAPNRGSLLLALVVAGGAATLAVIRLRGYPALVTNPRAGSGQAAQGDAYTRELVALVALAVAAQAALAFAHVPSALRAAGPALRRPAFAAGVAVVVLAGLGGVAATGAARASVRDAGDWLERQWQDFLDPAATPGLGTERLLTPKGERSDPYRVAIEAFKEHPLVGGGAGSFEVRYMRDRHIDLKLRNVHSLPLETLSEFGAVGMLLLLGFFSAVAVAAQRAVAGKGALRSQEAAAVAAALVVWLGDACVDWNWEMPALTGTAVVLSAALFQSRRQRRSSRAVGAAPPAAA